jgi:hypothetical protein
MSARLSLRPILCGSFTRERGHLRGVGRYAIAALVVALGTLASPMSAFAVDTISPAVVNLTLQAGQSTNVSKTLSLDGLPARADIIVAVDTTGSMGTPIAQAQADAVNICNQVQAAIPGARFAVVDFEDYFPGPGQSGDVPYALKTPGFTPSCALFSAAIATMSALPGSGGDSPEAYNRAFFEAYADGGNPIVLTRDPLATQFLVVLGDAAPHSATSFGSCPAEPPSDFGRDGLGGTADDLDTSTTIAGLNAADITLLMIRYTTGGVSVALSCYQDLAGATGGTAVDSSAAPSIGAFIVANAQAVPYTVNLQVSPGCPIGFAFSPAPPYGPFSGPQMVSFTETVTAPTLVGNYTCTVTAVLSPGGPTTAVQTVNVTVGPGPPATLTLTPAMATNTIGDQHCVTATVRDQFGNPTPGIAVTFTVTGANPTGGAGVTNASGQAQFCYAGVLPGTDTITAQAVGGSNPSATASKTWVLPGSTPGCKVTYGGRITAANGDRATFGGNAKAPDKGQQQYTDHGPATPMNVHSIDVLAVTCSADGTEATIFGRATIDGSGSFDYRIDLEDLATPGSGGDTYRIRLSNGYDSGQQTLLGGNVQIH